MERGLERGFPDPVKSKAVYQGWRRSRTVRVGAIRTAPINACIHSMGSGRPLLNQKFQNCPRYPLG